MKWTIEKHTELDKSFRVFGPRDIMLTIDYDDVDHEAVDLIIRNMVDTLNSYYPVDLVNHTLNNMYNIRANDED